MVLLIVCMLFVFRQKTAYEMRISDWSSDVCSSDLHEQGDGESALVVGQGDAHVAPARPDVQRVGFDAEAAVARGRDLELLVAVVEPFGALAEIMAGSHLRAQRGACAVAAEQGVERMRMQQIGRAHV